MDTRTLGKGGPAVSAIGLGCMGLSGMYGTVSERDGIATIHAALEAGITLLDTGDFYGMGHNELLLRDALAGRRDRAFLSVKFGALRGPDGAFLGFDGSPAHVKSSLAYTLRRLGTDYVDLYQPARVDARVPIEDTVGAIADLVRAGHVRHIGISEAGPSTIRRAHATHPIAALQIEYSLMSRSIEREILPTVRELGIAVVAYGVLSRGLIGGDAVASGTFEPRDFRARVPRFAADNLKRNLGLVDALRVIGAELDATPAQLAIAWALSRGADVVPLVGAKRPAQVASALPSLALRLPADALARIERAVPAAAVAGERYDAAQMAMLDSEKR